MIRLRDLLRLTLPSVLAGCTVTYQADGGAVRWRAVACWDAGGGWL